MGRMMKKKGESGHATSYVSRKQALTRLQLPLKDFRRLCILKGIYPVEPKHKKKVNKNNSTNKTYYFLKDIQFLLHEPVVEKFRAFKIFVRKLKRSIGRKDGETANRLRNRPPTYRLDHIVRERYPAFTDALRDLDDALSMCFLFTTMPKSRIVRSELVQLCRRLTSEFMHYVIETRSLRKVFISIKGFYYQAEVMGQTVTWIVPHNLGFNHPSDVDFKIMLTFMEFYSTMMGFVNFKLCQMLNLQYPLKLSVEQAHDKELLCGEEDTTEYVAALNTSLKRNVNTNTEEAEVDQFPGIEDSDKDAAIEEAQINKLKTLFENCKVFINRETPRESLVFVLRAFGGTVSFDKVLFVGATFDEDDETITHHIIDRPVMTKQYLNRYYIQPQWVYDSINARTLLPVEKYFPGEVLPPHLSPFVEEKDGEYVPPEKRALLDMQSGVLQGIRKTEDSDAEIEEEDELEESEEEETKTEVKSSKKRKLSDLVGSKPKMQVVPGVVPKEDPSLIATREEAEAKRLALMMMPKKKKHLYNKIVFGQKRTKREALKLTEKRVILDKEQKLQKKLTKKAKI